MATKKRDITTRVYTYDALQPYLSDSLTNNRLVVINVYNKFWGPVEVLERIVESMLGNEEIKKTVSFISVPYDVAPDIWERNNFASKPVYFIYHRGNLKEIIDGIDLPKLQEKLDKCKTLLY